MTTTRRAFLILAVTVFAYQFSFGITRAIMSNFYVEVVGLRADQMGLLTAFRELPGFLSFAIAALAMRFLPSHLAALCMLVMGVGYAGYAQATSFENLVPAVVFASVGFHQWMSLSSAMGLAIAKASDAGQVLGQLNSVGFAAGLLGMAVVLVGIEYIGYQLAWVISGLVLIIAFGVILKFPNELVQRSPQRMVFRRKYRLYYVLTFLDGCRMEVFQAFGAFLLVKQYQINVQTITLLLIVSSVINMALSPSVGRLIDRIGERPTMTFSYGLLFFVFLGLALIPDAGAAIALYVVYNFALLFSIGINTYLKRIASAEDVRPSLAMGVTTMHISALALPPIGGVLWQAYGFQTPFLLGAVFIVLSIFATQRIPLRQPATVQPPSAPAVVGAGR